MNDLNSIRVAKVLSLIGDKAYDFALPLAIIAISPGNALIAGLFIIIRKGFFILLMPKMGKTMDHTSCWKTIQNALATQMIMVVANLFVFSRFGGKLHPSLFQNSTYVLGLLFFSALVDSFRQLAEASSEISVKNFWVPKLFKGEVRTNINAQMKSLNLSTEVSIPMVTAYLFFSSAETNHVPIGFYLVSIANMISFIPEYVLFKNVANRNPDLKKIQHAITSEPIFELKKIINIPIQKLKLYAKENVFHAQVAFAFLGLTSLTPHSMLLRVYLLDYIKISNRSLALFSGASAFLGIGGVYMYTKLRKAFGLIRATHCMVFLQACLVVAASIYFNVATNFSPFLFLLLITLSRLGLYGFSLGSTEIEQLYIPESRTGFVMGISSALQQVAILAIFTIGTIFPEYSQFYISVSCSALGLSLSFIFFSIWTQKIKVYAPAHKKNLKIMEAEPLET